MIFSKRNDDTIWKIKVEYIKNENWDLEEQEFYASDSLQEIIDYIENYPYPGVSQIHILLDIK